MTKELFAAMAKAFPMIAGASKDKNNPHFKSKYADLSSVMDAIKPALVANGLWLRQVNHDAAGGVCVETFVCHAAGDELSFGKLFVPASKNDAQGYGSALTYARRYSLMTAFGVCPEDDDGNAAVKSNDFATARDYARQDEPKPAPLQGVTYSTRTALHKACTAYGNELARCDDIDTLEAFVGTTDWKAFAAQCEIDAAHYLHGGEPAPADYQYPQSR